MTALTTSVNMVLTLSQFNIDPPFVNLNEPITNSSLPITIENHSLGAWKVLCPDLLKRIFEYIHVLELRKLCSTCKAFRYYTIKYEIQSKRDLNHREFNRVIETVQQSLSKIIDFMPNYTCIQTTIDLKSKQYTENCELELRNFHIKYRRGDSFKEELWLLRSPCSKIPTPLPSPFLVTTALLVTDKF